LNAQALRAKLKKVKSLERAAYVIEIHHEEGHQTSRFSGEVPVLELIMTAIGPPDVVWSTSWDEICKGSSEMIETLREYVSHVAKKPNMIRIS